jgi:hypothetical protein
MKYPITDQDIQKLDNSYMYHTPKDDQAERYNILRELTHDLSVKVMELCPQSRERSLALTQLETALMWANKSIACNE